MPDPAIEAFFRKRREDWLKKETKASMREADILALEKKCADKFSYENWLPDAAKRAGQISISTHPCTFSHPSARKNKNGYVTSVIATSDREADGYLRSGNVEVEPDALGNAAALDVYKLLTLIMEDGAPLHQHIEQDTPLAKSFLSIKSEGYSSLKTGFMAMFTSGGEIITSSKIKQVYFPVDNNYHLLSVLNNSGLIYEMRRRIDELRFSEQQKQLRDKKRKDEPSDTGFSEIYNIATIGYGGTKPQNISVLNNKYGGKARLLLSAPPLITKHSTHFPKSDFFRQIIRYSDIHEPIQKLHKIFVTSVDGVIPLKNLQTGRDHRIEEIIDQIILKMTAVRSVCQEQYREENCELPHYQRVWLCDALETERLKTDAWLDELCEAISRWIVAAYKQRVKKAVTLGPAELTYIQQTIYTHREVLR